MGSGNGWVTAEYGMLPRSTHTRTSREKSSTSGRTAEIQRLIGRSLRSVARLDLIGERTYTVDCDVIKADGGTRTASITGAYVAMVQAMNTLVVESGAYAAIPVRCAVAAISAGVIDGTPCSTCRTRKTTGPRSTSTSSARSPASWWRCRARAKATPSRETR